MYRLSRGTTRSSSSRYPASSTTRRATDELAHLLDRALLGRYGDRFRVTQEKPFAAGALHEPEPDIAVLNLDQIRHGTDHPSTAHLIVEVSQSSRGIDLIRKAPIYAGAAVPLYWVVDVVAREVIVHSSPVALPAALRGGRDRPGDRHAGRARHHCGDLGLHTLTSAPRKASASNA